MQTRIKTIPILPFGMLNAFLAIGPGGAILVDTGLPGSTRLISRALEAAELGWRDIKLIVLTHGHIDHAGSAADIRRLTGAPVLYHTLEMRYCMGERPVLHPTRLFGRLFLMTGAIERPFPPVTADIQMQGESFDLKTLGFAGTVWHTPGHTPGSVSLLLSGGDVLAGDLAASGILLGGIALLDRPERPPFEEHPHIAARSLEELLSMGAKRFYLGHGGPLGVEPIARHAARLKRL
ncbi:MAG: beta-lactamase [Hoeflea sp. BRH_c9]|nr:MAG: beta-lactamase [Hoeflea sp. BRH_c9]